jgi:hypothetical protein
MADVEGARQHGGQSSHRPNEDQATEPKGLTLLEEDTNSQHYCYSFVSVLRPRPLCTALLTMA